MNWHRRDVLSWEFATSPETRCCLTALERALSIATPTIFHSDQGSQFTSAEFTERLINAGVLISHDGRGRVFDTSFVERLWRSVTYEEISRQDYETVREAKEGVGSCFRFSNAERLTTPPLSPSISTLTNPYQIPG